MLSKLCHKAETIGTVPIGKLSDFEQSVVVPAVSLFADPIPELS